MYSLARDRRRYLFGGLALFFLLSAFIWSTTPVLDIQHYKISFKEHICQPTAEEDIRNYPLKRSNVIIASSFGFHHDVFMAVAWTFGRVLGQAGTVQVYAPSPFNYDFQDIVDRLGLYHGTIENPENLIKAVNDDKTIDLIVLGTCEIDLRGSWNAELLKAWDNRDDAHKFQLVCIVHHVRDEAWQPAITEWSRRKAIRLLPISEHVAQAFRGVFGKLADNPNPIIASAGYEDIMVDVHVPVLDLPNLPQQEPDRILSNVVIQGSFNRVRRDYGHIFAELNASLSRDPREWGYSFDESDSAYHLDTTLTTTPFHLYLIGSGNLNIPNVLKNIVSIHVGLSYSEFYTLMGSMDLCLPAFAENGYLDFQASSTIAMAVECDVPILVTKRLRGAYTYIDDDTAVVTRPATIREIAAIKMLRTGQVPEGNERGQEMLEHGWKRDKILQREFKTRIWASNDRVVERLLRDM